MKLANNINEINPEVYTGTVKSKLEGKYLLSNSYGQVVTARKADSCLLAPSIGDSVLLVNAEGKTFILAVLTKSSPQTEIQLEGDVSFNVQNGKLDLIASNGLNLASPEEIQIIAKKLGLTSETLETVFKSINLVGTDMKANITNVKLFGKQWISKIDSSVQHYLQRHSTVDGVDSLTASTIKHVAKDIMALRSNFAFIRAKKNVRVDGEQILLG